MSVKVDALDHLVINVADVARSAEWYRRVSRPEGFHLQPLAEPGVRLSPHPAPIRSARRLRQAASARIAMGFRARSSPGRDARVLNGDGSAFTFASTK